VTIASEPSLNLQADGEILGETPVTAEVLPAAVRVIVPADPETEKNVDAEEGTG
jgi:diacylglycerol kinase family enzyme